MHWHLQICCLEGSSPAAGAAPGLEWCRGDLSVFTLGWSGTGEQFPPHERILHCSCLGTGGGRGWWKRMAEPQVCRAMEEFNCSKVYFSNYSGWLQLLSL